MEKLMKIITTYIINYKTFLFKPKKVFSKKYNIEKTFIAISLELVKKDNFKIFDIDTVIRNNNDNFLMGAMVGYIIADSLNDSPSARDIEVPKSSNYESSYTPSSSSSYDSGSYSSSYDSGSSSSSCDSGC